ncbi:MAG TPA: hypothetical protein VM008_03245 [Phycisphaerae bacterium]|nr:hypothetical protein [Phycisphaerae bacterium]
MKSMVRSSTTSNRRRSFGGSSIEYIAVLALIVIPLGILAITVIMPMIGMYMERISTVIGWPLG